MSPTVAGPHAIVPASPTGRLHCWRLPVVRRNVSRRLPVLLRITAPRWRRCLLLRLTTMMVELQLLRKLLQLRLQWGLPGVVFRKPDVAALRPWLRLPGPIAGESAMTLPLRRRLQGGLTPVSRPRASAVT